MGKFELELFKLLLENGYIWIILIFLFLNLILKKIPHVKINGNIGINLSSEKPPDELPDKKKHRR